jgi:acyl-CoA thioester hydrolase
MARVNIRLPEQFSFSTEITLYQSHMNYGGHLDNALLLSVVSEARVRFLKALGHTELNVDGGGIIVSDAAIQYRSEAFHGEVMVVSMGVADLARKAFDLIWCMREFSTQCEVARGKTGIVFYDYATRKVAPIPADFRQQLEQFHHPLLGHPELA